MLYLIDFNGKGDHLDSGSAVSITEEDRLRTTQSKTTNLSAEWFLVQNTDVGQNG
jgi:hypothetical protein